jgi:uncharacterized protein
MAFLASAGVVAGVVGTAGGITSLISYPALLAVGISPFAANVTNAVSLVGSGLGSTLGSQLELADQRRRLRRWAPLAVGGGLSGAALLLLTPAAVFGWIVPFLIAAASVLLLAQPRISAWRYHRAGADGAGEGAAKVAVLLVSAYSGYFGAGAGVLILAVLLLMVDDHLATANALKNAILTVADLLPAVAFALLGPVSWRAAVPLAVGATLGGLVGPRVTRRAPQRELRIAVALTGFGLAGWMLANAG